MSGINRQTHIIYIPLPSSIFSQTLPQRLRRRKKERKKEEVKRRPLLHQQLPMVGRQISEGFLSPRRRGHQPHRRAPFRPVPGSGLSLLPRHKKAVLVQRFCEGRLTVLNGLQRLSGVISKMIAPEPNLFQN